MPKALLTDVDGTLIDSNALHAESWRRAFEHFGIETSMADCWAQIGKGGDQVIPIFVPEVDRERLEKPIKDLRAALIKSDYMPRMVAFRCSRELLERAKANGSRIALATSSEKEDLPVLGRIIGGERGIDDLIDEAATSADAESSKPSADIFAAALKKLGIAVEDAPQQAVALGDTPWDAQAAGKLGIPLIGLTCGGWRRKDLLDAGCAEVWQDPADLLANFDRSLLA